MPPKRGGAALQEAEAESKRFRESIDGLAEELVCPITQELPLDPVTAEDGHVYEKGAIEEWFAARPEAELRSPLTNEKMGRRLLPALQVKNMIKGMVRTGVLSGTKADAWKRRLEEEEEVMKLRRRAEDGDADSMFLLGHYYREGTHGLMKDLKQAFGWFLRAAALDHPEGLGECGQCYCEVTGVEKDAPRGLVMLGQAAALGVQHACYLLGRGHEKGKYTLKQDTPEASRWYRKMESCTVRNSPEQCRQHAMEWLLAHPE